MRDTDSSNDPCALSGLYSLGALDGADLFSFESHLLDGCDACEEVLARDEPVVAVLAHAVMPKAPPVQLRERLLEHVAELDGAQPRPLYSADGDGEWRPFPVPGISVRPLYVDRLSREVVTLLRAEPGVRFPPHQHSGLEELFVLEGELIIGDSTYRRGDYIRSEAGSVHPVNLSPGGCMLFVRTSLDDWPLAA